MSELARYIPTDELIALLPQHVDRQRYMAALVAHVAQNRKLAECSRESLVLAARQACITGLELGGALAEAHIIPRKGVACFQPGYRGWIRMARRSNEIEDVHADVVRANDAFEWSDTSSGLTFKHTHASFDEKQRGQIVGAYAVAVWKSGRVSGVRLSPLEIARAKRAAATTVVWDENPVEMAKKTAIIRLCKTLPLTSEDRGVMNEVIARDYTFERREHSRETQRLNDLLAAQGAPPDADVFAGDDVDITDDDIDRALGA